MKKTLLLTLSVALYASNSNMNMKIQNLEKELQTLKQELRYHQEDLDERMPIIEKIEKKSILDKINFSPEILLRVDKFNYKSTGIKGENTTIQNPSHPMFGEQRRDQFTKDFDLATSMRFRLNMHADLDNIQFYGRLLYNNASQTNERVCILSRDIKTAPGGSAFDVDRAYIDYSPNRYSENPFTITFGILPTTGGTPMHFAQNKKRNSMFPALVFDMNTYGVIATQNIGSSSYARAILAKPYTLRANFYPYQCNRENIDDADITGLYIDTKFKFFGDALLSFGVNAVLTT